MRLDLKSEPTLRQQMEGRTVLVVDDEAIIRDLCAKVLKGYRVLEAGSGEEALAVLEHASADIILTDVMMPRMSGIDLLMRIKEREPTQAVVVMTGYADKDVILKALKADADDFITKPINLLQLRTTIDKVLERKGLKEELVNLKRMDRLKTEFLGLISHKLKTPTTAISLFIQNLAHGIGDPADEGFQKTLKMILEESAYLEYLIQDLLSFSEVILREGPPQPSEIQLRELALSVLNKLRPRAEARGIRLETRLPENFPGVHSDREQLTFALYALLDNAVKFTGDGGRVVLEGELAPGRIRLLVRDNGAGIAREELPKIFEKFYQIDPQHTGQVRGFGLGLFYARRFMQNLGGNLVLQSVPGEGTTAILTLPR